MSTRTENFIVIKIVRLCLLLYSCAASALAACECGYKIADPLLNSTNLFTEILETDFLHTSTVSSIYQTVWVPQNYSVNASAARGPYGKNASLANVLPNPLRGTDNWDYSSTSIDDAGLNLYVRANKVPGSEIGMSEVASARHDILHGSFRAGIKFSDISGTCGAFFWQKYYNNSQEIDIELLSRQQTESSYPMNLVIQSSLSAARGFDAANTPTFKIEPLHFDPTDGYHEYGFDWTPAGVSFFADGTLIASMSRNITSPKDDSPIPSKGGSINLSHWSNGDEGWSGGPPTQDAIMSIGWVRTVFNSSDGPTQAAFTKRCAGSSTSATCAVPTPLGSPMGRPAFIQRDAAILDDMSEKGIESGDKKSSMAPKIYVTYSWIGNKVHFGMWHMLWLWLALLLVR